MGWMAWERFRCDIACKDDPKNCISEGLFRDMADRLSEDGWKELGYEYVIIDDCWMSRLRDKQGRLQPEPSRLFYFFLLEIKHVCVSSSITKDRIGHPNWGF
ncbi:alpha-N-acetylgalactosaminidase-like [Notothenia coriiceps]|uniref:Alpha-N-acetylgalactosaminidase-like n=1 Tax=Notothenia coriiceps TaxID=8208 RepID=A0A6I9PI50_9TELE|nr:PREDICTED: alpha-N-acetylgalactosaminidase-like [Notothenia coriiceps]